MFTSLNSFLVKNVALLKRLYKIYRLSKKRKDYDGLNNEEIFSKIYETKVWDYNHESAEQYFSGTGSHGQVAEKYVDFVNSFIQNNGVKSITDIGCGDFAIGSKILQSNPQLKYNGCDVVKGLIKRNEETFVADSLSFHHLDAVNNDLPGADLLTIRQVFQHLCNEDIKKILEKSKRFKYVLVSEHLLKEGDEKIINKDKPSGPDTRIAEGSGVYIHKPPFNIFCTKVLSIRDDAYNKEAYINTYIINNVS